MEKIYTERQVQDAANAAADLILQGIECDQEMEDLMNLVVNATMSVLTSEMGAELEDVIEENYGVSMDEFKSERGF